MNHLSEREIRDLLAPKGTPAPPAGLAARLKSEIPEHLEVAPAGDAARFGRRSPFRTYLLAAGVLVAFGGAFLAYRVQMEMTPQEAPHLERDMKDDAAAPAAADGSALAVADADEIAAPTAAAAPAARELPSVKAEAAAPEIRAAELRRQLKKEGAERPASAAERNDRGPSRMKAPDATVAAPIEEPVYEAENLARPAAEGLRSSGYLGSARTEPARAEPANADAAYFFDRGAGPFVDTEDDALSTLAPDAGTASYPVVRRFLRDGRLPPPAAVRVEQLLNHFDHGDPARRGDVAIQAEGAPSPFAEGVRLLRFHLGAGAGARVQVELNPEVVARYRLVGYENREGDDERFRGDTLAAADTLAAGEALAGGETGAGHAVTVLYELVLRRPLRRGDEVATLRLRYGSVVEGETVEGETVETERRVTGQDFARTWDEASAALRLTSLVAEFGDHLEGSNRARTGDLGEVFRRARELAAELSGDADVAELALLIGRAAELRR